MRESKRTKTERWSSFKKSSSHFLLPYSTQVRFSHADPPKQLVESATYQAYIRCHRSFSDNVTEDAVRVLSNYRSVSRSFQCKECPQFEFQLAGNFAGNLTSPQRARLHGSMPRQLSRSPVFSAKVVFHMAWNSWGGKFFPCSSISLEMPAAHSILLPCCFLCATSAMTEFDQFDRLSHVRQKATQRCASSCQTTYTPLEGPFYVINSLRAAGQGPSKLPKKILSGKQHLLPSQMFRDIEVSFFSKEFDQRTLGLSLDATHEFEHAHTRAQHGTKENTKGISMNHAQQPHARAQHVTNKKVSQLPSTYLPQFKSCIVRKKEIADFAEWRKLIKCYCSFYF